jgi:tetratricopeptide (TPR) repeat protein
LRCADGKAVDTQHADADSEASLLSAVDLATERMRQRLGEPAASLQRFNTPLVDSTTSSLAALKEFTEGERKLQVGDALGAASDFKMAVDLDPSFALAYGRLGTIAMNSQQPIAGSDYIKKAFELRDRVSDKERLYIAGHYYTDVTGDLQRAIETYELWTTLYPRDWGPFNNLANLYDLLGNPQKAVEYAQIAAQINPNSNLSTATLAQAYMGLPDHERLSALCKSPAQAQNAFISFHNICFFEAYIQDDQAGMQSQLAWAKGSPQESVLLGSSAYTAFAGGRLRFAQQVLSSARENAIQNHMAEITTTMDLGQANANVEYGSPQEAIRNVQDALKTAQDDVEARAFAAMILAAAGQDQAAQKLAAATSQESPNNDAIARIGYPTVNAIVALHQHHAIEAINALEPCKPFLLYAPTKFMPAYYLGIAYLENKEFDKAAETFQWIIRSRGVSPDSVYVGLSALALGRTLSLEGKSQEAAQAYDQAIGLWQNADPDFQPLKQAKLARSAIPSATLH